MQSHDKYISASKIIATFSVSNGTLVKWANEGRVVCKRMPGGKRLYAESDIHRIFGDTNTPSENGQTESTDAEPEKIHICYARVSSQHQKQDLSRQVRHLQEAYPQHQLIQDIGSGLNFKRKGLIRLLEQVHAGVVATVVVQHRDRLCRYGLELVEWIFSQTGTKLVVHSELPQSTTPAAAATAASSDGNGGGRGAESDEPERSQREEFADDIMSIITFVVARNNNRRSAENRRERIRLHGSAGKSAVAPTAHDVGTAKQETKSSGRKRKIPASEREEEQPDQGGDEIVVGADACR